MPIYHQLQAKMEDNFLDVSKQLWLQMEVSQQNIHFDVIRLCVLFLEKHLQFKLGQLLHYVFFQGRELQLQATQDIWLAQNLSKNYVQWKGVLANAMEMGCV